MSGTFLTHLHNVQPSWGAKTLTYRREVGTEVGTRLGPGPGPGSGLWTRNAVAVQAEQDHGLDLFPDKRQDVSQALKND